MTAAVIGTGTLGSVIAPLLTSVELDQLAVYRERGTGACACDPGLDLGWHSRCLARQEQATQEYWSQ